MVCIAAFIILILVGVIVAVVSIFKRDLGRRYLKVLKKAGYCFSKKIRLQKCDTNFSDDVKNLLLKKVVIKRPKLVKPISIGVEIASVLIVILTAWSLVEAAKAGLALWVFGTCNVSQPSACALGAESCSIDAGEPKNPVEYIGRWFEEWGEIFVGIPDRLKNWEVTEEYMVDPMSVLGEPKEDKPFALDIMDPGCSVCMQSYKNQLGNQNFIQEHTVLIMLYPIELPDGGYKFTNSGLVTRYYHALTLLMQDPREDNPYIDLETRLLNRIFTEYNAENVNYQSYINGISNEEAEQLLQSWLREWGLSSTHINEVKNKAHSDEVTARMAAIKDIVENKIHAKGIPTMLYDGRKHMGLFKK